METAAFLYDVTDFSRKWLKDVVAEQLPNGAIQNFVPDACHFTFQRLGQWSDFQGSAGWGDAIVHVPWELYLATGRADVLSEQFEAMCRWVDFASERAASGRHPDRARSRPTPAPHERYLWDTGFHLGEWKEPPDPASDEQPAADWMQHLLTADHGPTATAYLHRSATELAKIARVLDRPEAAERYENLADASLSAWSTEFIAGESRVSPATQANLVRALAFRLVPENLKPSVASQLVDLIRGARGHLGTGFLATPFLLPVLADHGHLEVAYELLFQRTPPSWLHMLDAGATTIWEDWDSVQEDGTVKSSLNHFSMGAVISFLHRYVAGLQILEPGYRRFRVQPRPGGGLTSARAYHDCPTGRIEVDWRLDGARGTIKVSIPTGTGAELILPSGVRRTLGPGRHQDVWGTGGPGTPTG